MRESSADRGCTSDAVRRVWRPTELEIAAGAVVGFLEESPELPVERLQPRVVVAQIIRDALLTGPCYVSFSGGRDSSVILAIALDVARREGFPAPVPITNRYLGVSGAEEDYWQNLVIQYLGIKEWVILERREDADLLGPAGSEGLRRFGVLWPAPIFLAKPLEETARGGTVVTGEGGDEYLGNRRLSALRRALQNPFAVRRGLSEAAGAMIPTELIRRSRKRTFALDTVPWLKSPYRETFLDQLADEMVEPRSSRRALARLLARKSPAMGSVNRAAVARQRNVRYVDPLSHPRLAASIAWKYGRLGPAGRTQVLRQEFGTLLPDEIISRNSKAFFNHVYFGAGTRAFVAGWDGTGVDPSMVDADRLRQAWQEPLIDSQTALLLQSAWLHQNSGRSHP
jgi:asparagine synthetase B (glutamine-hydrolysing)